MWKLDRLSRDLRHLVNTVQDLAERGAGFKVLAGQGADIDTTTAGGLLRHPSLVYSDTGARPALSSVCLPERVE